jgi:hypothetical protein
MWDVDIIDVRSRAVLVRRHGRRTAKTIHAAFAELSTRLAPGHVPGLITTDEYQAYPEAVLATFGVLTPVEKQGETWRGSEPFPLLTPSPDLVYAQVDKQRDKNGKLIKVDLRLLFGTPEQLKERLEQSRDSRHVNTAFIERQNGVDRGRNPRKARLVGTWSKKPSEHRAVSWLTLGASLFCWPVSTLVDRERKKNGNGAPRTSAMELGLASKALTVKELLHLRPLGFVTPTMAQIRAGQTEFYKPEPLPDQMKSWPAKWTVRKSYKKMGVLALGRRMSSNPGT